METGDHDLGFFDVGTECPDLRIKDGDLEGEKGLQTAALISLFSDRRVSLEQVPFEGSGQRGWWADEISIPTTDQMGSRQWILDRATTTLDSVNRLEDVEVEAFQWGIEDAVFKSVNATAQIDNNSQIGSTIEIVKPDGDSFFFRFVWDGQLLRFESDSID